MAAMAAAAVPRLLCGNRRLAVGRPLAALKLARLAALPRSSRRAPLTIKAAAVTAPALEPAAAKSAAVAAAAATVAAAAAAGAGFWAHRTGALVALLRLIDPAVLSATMGSTFKLMLVCVIVAYLTHTKQLPQNAAPVLSKVSFSLLIPSMLFIKITQIIASQPSPSILLVVTAFTLLQIGAGALMASALERLVQRWGGGGDTAAAAGDGSQASGLASLVTLACSFGSTFTLPVVFLTNMLPGAAADRALGYLALVLLAWSPLLWSIGPAIVKGASGSNAAAVSASDSDSDSPTPAASQRSALASSPAATAARLRAFARQVATPPFLAVVFGAAAGATPLGRALVAPTGAAAAQLLGPVGGGLLRCVFDVVKMLASGALAGQSVVLAASLLTPPPTDAGSGSGSGPAGAGGLQQQPRQAPSPLGAAKQLLLPSSATEARVLAVVALTRFLLLPALMAGGVWGLRRAGLLPPAVLADPVLLLVLLAGSCMPSAQNLIILLSLRSQTQAQAPLLARLLLKLYAYAAIPVSLWTSGFATWLGVQVVS